MRAKKMIFRFWADDLNHEPVMKLVVIGVPNIVENAVSKLFTYEEGCLKIKMTSSMIDLNQSDPNWYEYFCAHYEHEILVVTPLKSARIISDMPVELDD